MNHPPPLSLPKKEINIHKELCSTLPLQFLPHSIGVIHHLNVVGLRVGATSDTRTAVGTATTVQG